LEVESTELADLKEFNFGNLNLEINIATDLETLNFAIRPGLIASLDSSIGMNCQTEIWNFENEKSLLLSKVGDVT